MEKKEIITLSGSLGSGKSSTADLVAKELGYKRFSSGDFMRRIGLEMGISIEEISIAAENNNLIDESIDNEVKKFRNAHQVVIDSRLAFYWIPESFKVYLDLPPEIAKERIMNNFQENELRQKSEGSINVEEILRSANRRLESEKKRYQELYGVDHTDKKNYDLVVDTSTTNLEQCTKIIIDAYKKWLAQ